MNKLQFQSFMNELKIILNTPPCRYYKMILSLMSSGINNFVACIYFLINCQCYIKQQSCYCDPCLADTDHFSTQFKLLFDPQQ